MIWLLLDVGVREGAAGDVMTNLQPRGLSKPLTRPPGRILTRTPFIPGVQGTRVQWTG